MSDARTVALRRELTLAELVDRVLDRGVVISGDITIALADVDLIHVGLRALLASVDTLEPPRTEPTP